MPQDRARAPSPAAASWTHRGAGRPVPEALREPLERQLDAPLHTVRIHESAEVVRHGAAALTLREQVHFAPGVWNPRSDSGRRLLAHELVHVLQQRRGAVAPLETERGLPTNHRPALEAEADRGAAALAAGQGFAVRSAPTPGGAGAAQMKLHLWPNPNVTDPTDASIVAAKAEVDGAAATIDAAVETGAQAVREYVGQWSDNDISNDELLALLHPNAPRHARNFVNKLIDWGVAKTPTSRAAAICEAGYVIEEYANATATEAGVETQVVLGGSRPDFRHQTKHTYKQDGETWHAHGLIDATSAIEAQKGHILHKVNRMSKADALHHPILYDCYYEDLGFGAVKAQAIDLSGPVAAQRIWRYKELARQRDARRESLRSNKPIKTIGKKQTSKKVVRMMIAKAKKYGTI